MGSSKAAAAAIALSIAANAAAPHRGPVAHAFVHPSPFAPRRAARRPPPSSPSPAVAHSTMVHPNNNRLRSWNLRQMTATNEELEQEVSSMRAKDIRRELESYGISTKSFFEKGELVEALVKAREEGRTPVDRNVNGDAATSSSSSGGTSGSGSSSSTDSTGSSSSRAQRIQEEMEKCKSLKVGELKKELESYGVSTKSYFEKSEFVRAVAEARVDGPKKSTAGGGSRRRAEEPYDPSYRDVIVTPFRGNKDLLEGKIITVRAR